MANIQIPRARLSTPATPPVPANNGDLIMKVMGNNPYAQAIDQITPVLAQALQRRIQLRQQANAIGQMASAAGEEAPTNTAGLTPEDYGQLLTIKTNRSKVANEQGYQTREEARKNNEQMLNALKMQQGTTVINPMGGTTKVPGITGLKISRDPSGLLNIDTSDFKPGTTVKNGPPSPLVPKNPLEDMQDNLDPMKPKSGMGKLAERSNASDRVLTLLDQSKGDPNVLQGPELAASVAALVQGGQSGRVPMEQLNHLTPSSLKGDVMKQWSWVVNHPSALGQEEFFKSLRETAVREKATIQGQILKTQKSRLAQFEPMRKFFPGSYSQILQNVGLDATKVKNGQYVDDQPPAGTSSGNEVKRVTQDGRTAIFDGNTKQFLRYDQ